MIVASSENRDEWNILTALCRSRDWHVVCRSSLLFWQRWFKTKWAAPECWFWRGSVLKDVSAVPLFWKLKVHQSLSWSFQAHFCLGALKNTHTSTYTHTRVHTHRGWSKMALLVALKSQISVKLCNFRRHPAAAGIEKAPIHTDHSWHTVLIHSQTCPCSDPHWLPWTSTHPLIPDDLFWLSLHFFFSFLLFLWAPTRRVREAHSWGEPFERFVRLGEAWGCLLYEKLPLPPLAKTLQLPGSYSSTITPTYNPHLYFKSLFCVPLSPSCFAWGYSSLSVEPQSITTPHPCPPPAPIHIVSIGFHRERLRKDEAPRDYWVEMRWGSVTEDNWTWLGSPWPTCTHKWTLCERLQQERTAISVSVWVSRCLLLLSMDVVLFIDFFFAYCKWECT